MYDVDNEYMHAALLSLNQLCKNSAEIDHGPCVHQKLCRVKACNDSTG